MRRGTGAGGVGQVSARLDWSEQGERYFYPLDEINIFNEQVKDPGTENLRARIALSEMPLGSSGSWEVGIWGDNLTDHDNVGYGIDFGGLGFGGRGSLRFCAAGGEEGNGHQSGQNDREKLFHGLYQPFNYQSKNQFGL